LNTELRECARCGDPFQPPAAVPGAYLCFECWNRKHAAEILLGKLELELKAEKWHRRQECEECARRIARLEGQIALAEIKASLGVTDDRP
jgi:DNA-directed RNA polymerase subunit RPC12/RpoP